MHEIIFSQKTEVFISNFNLRAEQNLTHLGRFMYFSQKVVGMTLKVRFNVKELEICYTQERDKAFMEIVLFFTVPLEAKG